MPAAPAVPVAAAAEAPAPLPSAAPMPVASKNVFGPWYEKTGEIDRHKDDASPPSGAPDAAAARQIS